MVAIERDCWRAGWEAQSLTRPASKSPTRTKQQYTTRGKRHRWSAKCSLQVSRTPSETTPWAGAMASVYKVEGWKRH